MPMARTLEDQFGVSRAELDTLSVPDSRVCREVEQLCRDVSSEALANHCLRSYAWAVLLGRHDGIIWDREHLFAAAMLHDLGLTTSYDRGSCFEVDGASAAREILTDLGYDSGSSESVADAIYLHMHEVSAEDSGEARLLAAGTSADVSGRRALEIPRRARSLVLEMFPRRGFKAEMIGLFEAQAERKPWCIVARYLEDGIRKRILDSPYTE